MSGELSKTGTPNIASDSDDSARGVCESRNRGTPWRGALISPSTRAHAECACCSEPGSAVQAADRAVFVASPEAWQHRACPHARECVVYPPQGRLRSVYGAIRSASQRVHSNAIIAEKSRHCAERLSIVYHTRSNGLGPPASTWISCSLI